MFGFNIGQLGRGLMKGVAGEKFINIAQRVGITHRSTGGTQFNSHYPIPIEEAVTQLRIVFGSFVFGANDAGMDVLSQPLTRFRATVEVAGVVYDVLFNGLTETTFSPGVELVGIVNVPVAANTTIWVSVNGEAASAITALPSGRQSQWAGHINEVGTTVTDRLTAKPTHAQWAAFGITNSRVYDLFPPIRIEKVGVTALSLDVRNDSKGNGTTDDYYSTIQGWTGRGLSLAKVPNIHNGGDGFGVVTMFMNYNNMVASEARRKSITQQSVNGQVLAAEVNDVTWGRTAAQMLSDRVNIKNYNLANGGFKTLITTCDPYALATDAGVPVGHPADGRTRCNAYNALVRANDTEFGYRYFDGAKYMEDPNTPGAWKSDTYHPTVASNGYDDPIHLTPTAQTIKGRAFGAQVRDLFEFDYHPMNISGVQFLIDPGVAHTLATAGTYEDVSDKANHATQATAGNRPAITGSNINGRNALSFDGGDVLVPASALHALSSGNNTIICVVKLAGGSTNNTIFETTDAGGNPVLTLRYVSNRTKLVGDNGFFGQGSEVSGLVDNTSAHILMVRRSGSVVNVYIDGVKGTNGTGASITSTNARIGDSVGGFNKLTGLLGYFCARNRALTVAEMEREHEYLSKKFGIPYTTLT